MKQQEIPGFKILMIRQVPMGSVLNAETADSYPLVECGTWISDNGHWMIQTYGKDKYMLAGHDKPDRYYGLNFCGSLEKIMKEYNIIPKSHK